MQGYDRDTFGCRLKAKRIEKRLSVEDVASAAGLSVSMVRRCEAGRNAPSFENAARLAQVLGCSLDYLVDLPAPSRRKQAAR